LARRPAPVTQPTRELKSIVDNITNSRTQTKKVKISQEYFVGKEVTDTAWASSLESFSSDRKDSTFLNQDLESNKNV
jgi:hypothetical protein